MKKVFVLLFACTLFTGTVFSQIKYDNGGISVGNNFATVGSWSTNSLTYSFQSGTTDITGTDEYNAVRQAFQIWADYSNLTFTEVPSGGDIIISWGTLNHGDGVNFDGTNGVLAHAYYPPPFGGSYAGDVHFDDDETWSMSTQSSSAQPIDLVTVALHEIGHSLGLAHSTVTCSVMDEYYRGSHRYLSQDDVDAIRSLYGAKKPINSSGTTCTSGTFFINNLAAGASVSWSSSNTAIATISTTSNQGIATWAGTTSGTVTITATITYYCYPFSSTTVTESVDRFFGTLATPDGITSPGYDLCIGSRTEGTATYNVINPVSGLSYQWQIDGVDNGNGTSTSLSAGNMTAGTHTLRVRSFIPGASCYSAWKTRSVRVVQCGRGKMIFSPNPAMDNLNISLPAGPDELSKKVRIIQEVQLINKMGALVFSQKMKAQTNTFILNVSSFKSDVYTLRVFDGATWTTDKVIIRH